MGTLFTTDSSPHPNELCNGNIQAVLKTELGSAPLCSSRWRISPPPPLCNSKFQVK